MTRPIFDEKINASLISKTNTHGSDGRRPPEIKHIVPTGGSPDGGQIITIAGWHLKSQNFNVGSKTDQSTKDEGDDYLIWFEMDGEPPLVCEMDRHFSIIALHVGDYESIFCRTPKVTKRGRYRVKMKIDGGDTTDVGNFDFETSRGPTIEYIFPAASAPARDKSETFEQIT